LHSLARRAAEPPHRHARALFMQLTARTNDIRRADDVDKAPSWSSERGPIAPMDGGWPNNDDRLQVSPVRTNALNCSRNGLLLGQDKVFLTLGHARGSRVGTLYASMIGEGAIRIQHSFRPWSCKDQAGWLDLLLRHDSMIAGRCCLNHYD
jgi:hypothetical protein